MPLTHQHKKIYHAFPMGVGMVANPNE